MMSEGLGCWVNQCKCACRCLSASTFPRIVRAGYLPMVVLVEDEWIVGSKQVTG